MSEFIRGLITGASIATVLVLGITAVIIANTSELHRYKEGQRSILQLLQSDQISLECINAVRNNKGNGDEQ